MPTWPEARAAKAERQRREAANRPSPPLRPGREPAKWRADLPLMVCKGGPRAGAWYFADDGDHAWSTMLGRSQRAWDECGALAHEDTILGYVQTSQTVDHPRFDGPDGQPLTGTVWLWSPDRAAQRERQRRQEAGLAQPRLLRTPVSPTPGA